MTSTVSPTIFPVDVAGQGVPSEASEDHVELSPPDVSLNAGRRGYPVEDGTMCTLFLTAKLRDGSDLFPQIGPTKLSHPKKSALEQAVEFLDDRFKSLPRSAPFRKTERLRINLLIDRADKDPLVIDEDVEARFSRGKCQLLCRSDHVEGWGNSVEESILDLLKIRLLA